MHYGNGGNTTCQDVLPEQFDGCSDLNTTAFLKRVIADEKPDLLVFSGEVREGLFRWEFGRGWMRFWNVCVRFWFLGMCRR